MVQSSHFLIMHIVQHTNLSKCLQFYSLLPHEMHMIIFNLTHKNVGQIFEKSFPANAFVAGNSNASHLCMTKSTALLVALVL